MKNKCLRFITLIPLCSAFLPVLGQLVSEDAAVSVALRYFGRHAAASGSRSAGSVTAAGVTPWTAGDTTTMYAVRMTGGGWVLVAADARVTPVLAYSESGRFSADSMPDGMRWLLDGYAERIRHVMADTASDDLVGYDTGRYTEGSDIYTPGEYLLNLPDEGEILWNQNHYPGRSVDPDSCERAYNSHCPSVAGLRSAKASSSCDRAPAGCGPVAAGMIMRYWKWPMQATVPAEPGGKDTRRGVYDWDDMPVQINLEVSVGRARKVAAALRDIGYAADADYAADGTGTGAKGLLDMFRTFSYHASHSKVSGNWSEIVRNEINQGRPVIYGGDTDDSGHWFVVDGYDPADPLMFHVNWGWGGSGQQGDYFVLLSAPRPKNTNIYYEFSQEIIYEIYPECRIAATSQLTGTLTGDWCIEAKKVEVNAIAEIGSSLFIRADDVTFEPGSEIHLGASVTVITPSYSHCQNQGPGKR